MMRSNSQLSCIWSTILPIIITYIIYQCQPRIFVWSSIALIKYRCFHLFFLCYFCGHQSNDRSEWQLILYSLDKLSRNVSDNLHVLLCIVRLVICMIDDRTITANLDEFGLHPHNAEKRRFLFLF